MPESVTDRGGLSRTELDIMRGVEDDHWWYRALHDHVINNIQPSRPDFTLLDAGCGSGGMLARLGTDFPRASLTGVDLSEHALELTRARKTNARLVQASVQQMPFADAAFEIVLSLDVLYHRDVSDRAAVREMQRVLRPGGIVIVNVPAFAFLRGSHDIAVNTARRYTGGQLKGLLEDAGFVVEKITYWNMTLLPLVALVRWASRRRATQAEVRSDLTSPSASANSILGTIVRFELALSRGFSLPFGTSLFAVARK